MPNRKTSSEFAGFFTVRQVAEQLGLSPRTILWQILNDYLSGAQKFGEGKRGVWLIPQSAIDNYVPPQKGRRPLANKRERNSKSLK